MGLGAKKLCVSGAVRPQASRFPSLSPGFLCQMWALPTEPARRAETTVQEVIGAAHGANNT